MNYFDFPEALEVWRPMLETAAGMALESKFTWAKRFAVDISEPFDDVVSVALIVDAGKELIFSKIAYSTDFPADVLSYYRFQAAYSIIEAMDNFAEANHLKELTD